MSTNNQPPLPRPTTGLDNADAAAYAKVTRGGSCLLCQTRKVRCDKRKPCANCIKAGVECRIIPPQPPRRRKKKPDARDLVDRLRHYELLLAQNGIEFDPIAQELDLRSNKNDEVEGLEHELEELHTSPPSVGPDGKSKRPVSDKPFRWFPFYREFKHTDDWLRDTGNDDESVEGDTVGPTIHNAFDTMFDSQDGFPFVIGGGLAPVTNLHPPGIQIFQLWQVYLDNVNPLLKLTHTPTLQAQIIEASANIANIAKPLEALMFSIYLIAVTSLHDDQAETLLGEPRNILLSRYHYGCQQALINAGFMRNSDMTTLQAFLLYLIAIRQYVDPRSLFCLLGIVVRIAQRLGLHRDGAQFGLKPFEVEMRRRLWWQLVIMDKRLAEVTGSTLNALNSSHGDTKWPLNVNDADLHTNGKDPPVPLTTATEMIFCLTRFEVSSAAKPGGITTIADLSKPRHLFTANPTSSTTNTPAGQLPLPTFAHEEFFNHIETTYLQYCDPKIPVQYFTTLIARQNLLKLRIIDHLAKVGPRDGSNAAPASLALRESLVTDAIRCLESDTVTQNAESLRGFTWYTFMLFPFPAYLYLAIELRHFTTGPLAESAWTAMAHNHNIRNTTRGMRTPMHVALSGLVLKAWEARVAAEARAGRVAVESDFVLVIKEKAALQAKHKSQQSEASTVSPTSVMDGSTASGQEQRQRMNMITPPSLGDLMGAMGQNSMAPPPPSLPMDGLNQGMLLGLGMPEVDFGNIDWSTILEGLGGMPGNGGMEANTFGHVDMGPTAGLRPT